MAVTRRRRWSAAGEPAQPDNGSYFMTVPPAFEPRTGEWLLVPLHHIFGSEELSRSAPAVLELAPQAYVALNPDDALQLGVQTGKDITVDLAGTRYRLPVKIRPELPKGVAGLPAGVPPLEGISLPGWSKLSAGK